VPTPSKFTEDRKQRVLEALRIGASHQTAAAIAGIDAATLTRWLQRGRAARSGAFREFVQAVEAAEAEPKMRALAVVYEELPNRPELAWKFIERRERGYAPPIANTSPPNAGPVVIQLRLSDGGEPALTRRADVIEVENEQDRSALPAQTS
jgi:transposase-like protein